MQTLKVTIAGPAGSGKSGLAAALETTLRIHGFRVRVVDDKPNPNLRSFPDLGRTPLPDVVQVEIETVRTNAEPAGFVVPRRRQAVVDYPDHIGAGPRPDPAATGRTLEAARRISAEAGIGAVLGAAAVQDSRTVEEAFELGDLRVEVDDPVPVTRQTAAFVGDDLVKPGTQVRVVHVISKPARGEVRGYVLVEGETALRLRTPCYSGDWPEMDAAVQRRVLEIVDPLLGGAR